MSPSSSGSNNKPNKKLARSRWQAEQVSCMAYSSTLKMKVTCSPETSVDFKRTKRRYIPEDKTVLVPVLYI
jgi:hypothetical protein